MKVQHLDGEPILELLVVCGHCHWEDPLGRLNDHVQVLNVDARAVLLLRDPG
ncbi:MAG: hypothetical protein ACAI25_15360 [Planctomycetota bacterium]